METQAIATREDIIIGTVSNIPLSEEERLEYIARTARIQENFQQVAIKSLEIWKDLQYIQDNRLYREKYDTYQSYCQGELGRDNSSIYRLIKSAELKENLLLAADSDEERLSIMSLSEGNARFIRRLPAEVQEAFWKLSYGVGTTVLPHKVDNSIDVTTAYLESVAEQIDSITELGGIHIDGQFIEFDKAAMAAKAAGTDENTVKTILMTLGVTEGYYEAIQRQRDHIKEKSMKVDTVSIKGTIEARMDKNDSEYPVIIDSHNNEIPLNDLLLSFGYRYVTLSLRSPIKE